MKRIALTMVVVAVAALASAAGGDMLEPGFPFPRFDLKNQDGATVSSDALRGAPYLLYFYPKADTPGCTKEACTFRDAWADLKAAGLTVLGVSFDSPKANKAFAEKYHLPFPLLSDSDHALAEQVGAARPLLPLPKRISYLVGADGTVLAVYPNVDPATHAAQVLADFKRLTAAK